MLRSLIDTWGKRSWWVQINDVELSKRHWMWQAIDLACAETNSRIKIEMSEFDNGTEARTGRYRNAFRRHMQFPVRIIPYNRFKAPRGWKGTGFVPPPPPNHGKSRYKRIKRKYQKLKKKLKKF
mmetsp:Transcript_12129/g.16832  ORF Transcript_12129/g.16832 Transcript_12129/m.16832 type:complete len:124 (+) Transcript_12129:529-900(+)